MVDMNATITTYEKPWDPTRGCGPRAIFRTIRRQRQDRSVIDKVFTVIDTLAWRELRHLLAAKTGRLPS